MPEESSIQEASYRFHIFISYRRVPKVEEWVWQIFKDELANWLREWLDGDEPSVFCDRQDIPTGSKWPLVLADGLRTSCCLVPVWTPSYFQSRHCLAELETFLRREDMVGNLNGKGLIVPVLWHPVPSLHYPRLQRSVRETQSMDFTRFTFTGNGFRETARYMEFQEKVREFAKDVAQAVQSTPDFRPDWPLVTPEEVASGNPPPPPTRISRLILRKTA